MILEELDIHLFRNILDQRISFEIGKNFIFGENGQGKTNILESIFILCLAKSFRTSKDTELIPFDNVNVFFEGMFTNHSGISKKVAVVISPSNGKTIYINRKKLTQFSKLIGQFPVVVLCLDDYKITSGPPAFRRRFFDILLSQISYTYLSDLKEYDRILKQRNILLSKRRPSSEINSWTIQLIKKGFCIITNRHKLVQEINEYIGGFYQSMVEDQSVFRIEYQPDISYDNEESILNNFEKKLKNFSAKEQERGITLVGPHRDEFIFFIDTRDVRRFGSRGEQKSILISLKAAEAQILKKKTNINPILLLDDLYAELDEKRGERCLNIFPENSQSFITGTTLDYLTMQKSFKFIGDYSVYFLKQGRIQKE